MRNDSIPVEEARIGNVHHIEDYPSFHERHRIFPQVFKGRNHRKVLDIAAGVGVVGKRIMDYSDVEVVCNDISPSCLQIMRRAGIQTVSFDIDDSEKQFPIPDSHFDAVISLASIEHIIDIDHYMNEIYRILKKDGCLYISSPNYAGIIYLLPVLLKGRSFHNPLVPGDRYEFYAHVRYFTYVTLLEYVRSFGFSPVSVYLALPKEGSRFNKLMKKSKARAMLFYYAMKFIYNFLGPRWASEPVICFQKNAASAAQKLEKVIL